MPSRLSIVRDPVTLGRLLRDARRRRGWTQQQLAERAGLGQPTLSNIERGTINTPIGSLLRVLATLELDLVLTARQRRDAGATWDD